MNQNSRLFTFNLETAGVFRKTDGLSWTLGVHWTFPWECISGGFYLNIQHVGTRKMKVFFKGREAE